MTAHSYDAWSEFDPELAAAIRYAVRTDDWSNLAEYDPDVANALRFAVRDGDWRLFNDHVAIALRAAIGQDRVTADAEADRTLAADMRRLSGKYPLFGQNAEKILNYAVENGVSDLDIAFKAWHSATGQTTPPTAAVGTPSGPAEVKTADRVQQIEARLARLHYKDDDSANRERADLKFELEELRDEGARQLQRATRDNDEYADNIREINDASRIHNAERAYRRERGLAVDTRQSITESRAKMDLAARDLFRGKAPAQPAPTKKTPAQRLTAQAEQHGWDAKDRAAVALYRKNSTDSAPPSTTSAESLNANDVISQIASEASD
jgi:hypothetical protein